MIEKMGRSSSLHLLVLVLHLVSSFLVCTFSLNSDQASTKKCYIVYLGSHSHGPTPSSYDLEVATYSHYDLLSQILGSHEKAKESIIYSYNKNINGFAALLEEAEAEKIAKKANVVSVFLSKEHKPHTTRSWEFLGLRRNAMSSAWQKGRFGVNTIIANIDTGVWPESKSFNDKGIGPIPAKWRGGNVCQIDNLRGSNKAPCNRKLIGARFFSRAYEEVNKGKIPPSQHTARDFVGHGTHTLSTAGGNFVAGAHVFGNGNGTAKGGSPSARVAAYKACWSTRDESSCHGADVLDAIDHAISDGADVISISAGGRTEINANEILTDEISIGAFHALARNVLVVASAGNEGPQPETVTNVAPWLFTVAASTIDRDFTSTLTLTHGNTNQQVNGASLFVTLPAGQSFPVINAADARLANATRPDAQLCKAGTLDPAKAKGRIVVCLRGGKIRSVAEGQEALSAGAVGMIMKNDDQDGNTLLAEPHLLSTTGVDHRKFNGNTAQNPTVSMSAAKTVLGTKPAPVMASFSSRGPNVILPSILKPDITAPGVNILSSYSLAASASNLPSDPRRGFRFNVMQGTSMSCPHIAGIAGLLKTRHPNWSPAAIKSAIMTTATTLDNTNKPIQDGLDNSKANPFAYGSGHVQPDLAMDPGLVYDIRKVDYLNFLCASGYSENLIATLNSDKAFVCSGTHRVTDLNYPSITLPNLELDAENVTRTVTNVGPPSTYVATASLPGFRVAVVPNRFSFNRIGERKTFRVIVQATSVTRRGKYQFGELRWTNGNHIVRSPIVVRRI